METGIFDEPVDRRHSGSFKWDIPEGDDVIPAWVADMDFRAAPAIIEALETRVAHGVFGYVRVPDSYYDSLINWFRRRHDWEIDRDMVIYTSGVVPAISAIIKAMVSPGEAVILQTPAYNCFFSSIRNNNARLLPNPLRRVETSTGFTYQIDFENLEHQAANPLAKLLILCNPHNPTGRVWTRSELEKVRDICHRNGVLVVSDEIHCELTHPDFEYVPYATVDSEAIVCCSPSKAFNIAGLQIANIICPDEKVLDKVDRAINNNEVCDVNPFGVVGLQAAYNKSEDWLDSLRYYLLSNYRFLREYLSKELPEVKICDSESTYLAWLDIRGLKISSEEVYRKLLEKGKILVSSGDAYHGPGYIRLNYACPHKLLEEILIRIVEALKL